MLKQIYRGICWLYDMVIHGYDTTQNVFVTNKGEVIYLKDLKERFGKLKEEDLLPFPTEFARRVEELCNPKGLESKTEPPEYQI